MPRLVALPVALIILTAAAGSAGAVVKGTSSALGSYTVRLTGPYYCSAVVIGRQLVATAAHCANRGMRVQAGGRSIGIAAVARSAVLDDGRRVTVSGDAAILKLAAPLPGLVSAAPVGQGDGDSFTIAGYGTTDERFRGSFGTLHEASLVAAEPRALVDPNRAGSIGASACFGDSGGPVMRGGELVGIITRAAHPSPRIACGHLTRWAPVTVSGAAAPVVTASADTTVDVAAADPDAVPRRKHRRRKAGAEVSQAPAFALFGWLAPAEEKLSRRSARRNRAQR